ncbi:MAG: response regulator [Bacteroidota bacterium]|jgi:DNA-binding response OmpR family regulator
MKRIALVEDDFILSFVVKRYLEKMGHDCIGIASTCEEAIMQAETLDPELVLMDINLSGSRTGIDAANAIRKFSEVPIVFLTGNSDQVHKDKMESVPKSDYIIKPVGYDELEKKIEEILQL